MKTIETPFLEGQLSILQPERGYRFSADALWLAGFVLDVCDSKVPFVELGTGSGVVSAMLLKAGAPAGTGVELDREMVDCTQQTMEANGLTSRYTVHEGNLCRISEILPAGGTGLVVSNPPFFPVGSGRLSGDPRIARARHELACTLRDVVTAGRYLLADAGHLFLVYPVSRLVELLAVLPEHKLTPAHVRFVHSWPGEHASHLLVHAHKGTRRQLEVLPPLFTHAADGTYGPWYRKLAARLSGNV